MRTVRTLITRLTAVLAMAGAVVLAAPGTATAGGPTSVLLASPYTDSATGLYYTDPTTTGCRPCSADPTCSPVRRSHRPPRDRRTSRRPG